MSRKRGFLDRKFISILKSKVKFILRIETFEKKLSLFSSKRLKLSLKGCQTLNTILWFEIMLINFISNYLQIQRKTKNTFELWKFLIESLGSKGLSIKNLKLKERVIYVILVTALTLIVGLKRFLQESTFCPVLASELLNFDRHISITIFDLQSFAIIKI